MKKEGNAILSKTTGDEILLLASGLLKRFKKIDEDFAGHFALVCSTCLVLAVGIVLTFCFASYLVAVTTFQNHWIFN
ncbi:MAG: hypothetical protein ACKVOQ_03525 [Cyclobacteriaceae bacterium]